MNAVRRFDVIGASLPEAPYPSTLRAKGFTLSIDWELIEQSDTWVICPVNLRPWLLMIWTRSWVSAPAGSYTADDEAIAARIGMPLREFQVNRDYLMRGWYRANDGRLYHPFVSKLVLDMAGKREKDRKRVSEWRALKNQQVSGNVTRNEQERAREYDTGTGTGTGTGTREEKKIAPRKRVAAAAKPPEGLSDLIADGVTPEHAADWLKVRKSKKAAWTATAWEGVKREALKAGLSAGEAVETAAVNSWAGFKASWLERPNTLRPGERPAEKMTFAQRDAADKAARYAEIGGAAIAAKPITFDANPFTLENQPELLTCT